MQKGLDPDAVKKNSYYFSWTGLPHMLTPRQKRIKALINEISVSIRKVHLQKIRPTTTTLAAK